MIELIGLILFISILLIGIYPMFELAKREDMKNEFICKHCITQDGKKICTISHEIINGSRCAGCINFEPKEEISNGKD